jgi:hypothetical protein
LTKYSTRRNSEGLVDFIPEPEQVYRRRLAKASSRRILSHLGFESISDIHLFFVNNSVNLEMEFMILVIFQILMVILMQSLKKQLKSYLVFKGIMLLVLKFMLNLL